MFRCMNQNIERITSILFQPSATMKTLLLSALSSLLLAAVYPAVIFSQTDDIKTRANELTLRGVHAYRAKNFEEAQKFYKEAFALVDGNSNCQDQISALKTNMAILDEAMGKGSSELIRTKPEVVTTSINSPKPEVEFKKPNLPPLGAKADKVLTQRYLKTASDLLSVNKYAEAGWTYEELSNNLGKVSLSDKDSAVKLMQQAGNAYSTAGHKTAAERCLKKASALSQTAYGNNAPRTNRARMDLVEFLLKIGRAREANDLQAVIGQSIADRQNEPVLVSDKLLLRKMAVDCMTAKLLPKQAFFLDNPDAYVINRERDDDPLRFDQVSVKSFSQTKDAAGKSVEVEWDVRFSVGADGKYKMVNVLSESRK